jgi:hypothetical protein
VSLFAGAVLAVGMSTATVESAEAYTYYRASKAGKVVVLDQVQGTHYQQCVGYIVIGGVRYPNCTWSPALIAPQNRIARSSATESAQRVTVTWYLQRYEGGWYTHTKRALVYTIPKGTSSIRTHDWFVIPTKSLYMRMVLKVNWKSAKTGKTLGAYRAVFNEARDYRCVTRYPCQVAADSIWLKTPGT